MKHIPTVCRLFVMLLAIIFGSTAKAQNLNCYEGQGILENSWNDDSWCTDNLKSTAYTYTGSYSIQVTYTGAWQAFSLDTTSFPAKYFSALTFVVNGGSTSGRSVAVSLGVNGGTSNSVNIDDYIQGGSILANTWRQVTIPLSAFGPASDCRHDQRVRNPRLKRSRAGNLLR